MQCSRPLTGSALIAKLRIGVGFGQSLGNEVWKKFGKEAQDQKILTRDLSSWTSIVHSCHCVLG